MLRLNIVIVILLISIGTVAGEESDRCPSSDGEIWTQHADGTHGNQFNRGEDVYLGGQYFEPYKNYSYEVLDRDNDRKVVVEGVVSTDGTGKINVEKIGTIPSGDYDGHDYLVKLDVFSEDGCSLCSFVCGKVTGVTVAASGSDDGDPSEIPEYPTVMIPAIMAFGGYMAIRLKRRKG